MVYELSIPTLPDWNSTIIAWLKALQTRLSNAETGTDAQSVHGISVHLSALRVLIRSPAFIAFLNQTDIKESLWKPSILKLRRDAVKAEAQWNEWLQSGQITEDPVDGDISTNSARSTDSDSSNSSDSNDSADLRVIPGQPKYGQLLHWMKNFTAWDHAVHTLASQPLLSSNIPIFLSVVTPPIPGKQMTPIRTIVESALCRLTSTRESVKDNLVLYLQHVVNEIFSNRPSAVHDEKKSTGEAGTKGPDPWLRGDGFTGAVHCEATLCALRYACEKSELRDYAGKLDGSIDVEAVEQMFKVSTIYWKKGI
jgi:hypothetical protein